MKEVAVSELKAKLSEYLRQVAKGMHLVVTDRGRPIAEMIGYGRLLQAGNSSEAAIRTLAETGALQLAIKIGPLSVLKNRPQVEGSLASQFVVEDRK